MAIKNSKDLFVQMLSGAWHATERTGQLYLELSQATQDTDVKESLEARSFITQSDLAAIDQCFKLIGEQPVKPSGRMLDVFVEDFRKELGEIQSPIAKVLYVLAKANHLTHFRMASYEVLIAAADRTGHLGVGVLLESCLADKLAFIERNRRMMRKFVETKVTERLAA